MGLSASFCGTFLSQIGILIVYTQLSLG